jgi:hypothetical protein
MAGPVKVSLLDEQLGTATSTTIAVPGAGGLSCPASLLTTLFEDLHRVFSSFSTRR